MSLCTTVGSKRVVETRAENAEKKVEFLKAQRNEFEDTLEKLMKQMDVISAEVGAPGL